MKTCRIFAALMMAALLGYVGGCAGRPTPDQIEQADCGLKPDEQEAEQAIRKWGDRNLKDPESARYEFVTMKKGYYFKDVWNQPSIVEPKPYFAWEKGTLINAKNSYGGYTGARPYFFYFRDGSLVWVYTPPHY